MKKVLAFAAFAVILAGCAKEIVNQIVESTNTEEISKVTKVVLHASIPELDTKVSTDNAGAYKWQAGDIVTVLNTSGNPYEFDTETGGTAVDFASATFDGTLSTEAFYPESGNHASGKFYLEPSIDWSADSSLMPMLGTVNPSELSASFQSAGAVIKLICYNVDKDADKLVVTSDSKQIVGQFTPSGSPKVITASDSDENKTLTINFATAGVDRNMVFYIPLPTGNVGTLTFEIKAGSTVKYTKTTKAAVTLGRNTVVVPSALNLAAGGAVEDAKLTNAQIIGSALTGSYTTTTPVTISNTFGDWVVSGMKGGNYKSSGNYFVQIRNNATVSYIQLPSFANNIATVVLEGVCNSSETKYTGSIYFRSTADNEEEALATGTSVSAKDNVTLTIPSGYKTGYIMSSGACLISSITVTFSSGTPATIPVINTGAVTATISAGNLNGSVNSVSLSNPVDGLGINAVYTADWIESAVVNEGRLDITATEYNHNEIARSATITLKATGATNKVITVTQNPSVVQKPTLNTPTPGNHTFTLTWTGDGKAGSYDAYYSTTANLDISGNPADDGIALNVSHIGTAYTALPNETLTNGTTYYIYVRVGSVAAASAAKYVASSQWAKTSVVPSGGTTVNFVYSTDSQTDYGDANNQTNDGVTITATDGTSNNPVYSGSQFRIYAGSSLTITVDNPTKSITQIVIEASSTSYNKLSADDFDWSGTTGTWDGTPSNSVSFSVGNSGSCRIKSIAVTYE